jgi:hypothetical protein
MSTVEVYPYLIGIGHAPVDSGNQQLNHSRTHISDLADGLDPQRLA